MSIDFCKYRVDILEAFNNEPVPLDFIWPGFLAGTVGTLFAPGATSKSFWAIQASIAVAGGGDTVGVEPGGFGRVVYLAAEDPQPVLQHRLYAIGARLSPEDRAIAAERVDLLSVVGAGLDAGDKEQRGGLVEFCLGARLVIIDTISRAHRLDENSNGEMARLLMWLEMIARQTGAAILFLHHISKFASRAGDSGDQFAARGAGALTDNARMGSALSKMTSDEA
ncbi:MAG: helicase RepA family protein, partial [Acidiferrobacter sp.]